MEQIILHVVCHIITHLMFDHAQNHLVLSNTLLVEPFQFVTWQNPSGQEEVIK